MFFDFRHVLSAANVAAPTLLAKVFIQKVGQVGLIVEDCQRDGGEGEDMRIMIEGIRLGRRIVAAAPFARLRGAEISPGLDVESDAALRSHISQNAQTYYHPVGTCKMGVDPMAVVDPELRVHGLEGLRVADASIMPTIPRANTNAAAIMIGEKAADLIRGAT